MHLSEEKSNKYLIIMRIFYRLFVAYLVATPYILFSFGDEIQGEVDANANARQSLDELSKEVNQMKAEFTKNNESPDHDTVSDGGGGDGGNKQRAVLGEIDTIKKIIDILETVVVPTIVDSQNAAKSSQNKATATGSASVSSDAIKILPKGFKLLQHHGIIADDGQSANYQKYNPQSDDY